MLQRFFAAPRNLYTTRIKMIKRVFFGSAVRTVSMTMNRNISDLPEFDMKNPFDKEKKLCILCKYNITPDYKNVQLLSQFQSPFTGRIYGKHITGLCESKQKQIEIEIIKAQNAGLMPYYFKHIEFVRDPKLFDPENPVKPHRY